MESLAFGISHDSRRLIWKRLRGFRAMAWMSVLSKWYTSILVGVVREEREPIEWEGPHVGAVSTCKRY